MAGRDNNQGKGFFFFFLNGNCQWAIRGQLLLVGHVGNVWPAKFIFVSLNRKSLINLRTREMPQKFGQYIYIYWLNIIFTFVCACVWILSHFCASLGVGFLQRTKKSNENNKWKGYGSFVRQHLSEFFFYDSFACIGHVDWSIMLSQSWDYNQLNIVLCVTDKFDMTQQ